MTEDKMVEWHHRLDGHQQMVMDREVWHATVPWARKESDTTV